MESKLLIQFSEIELIFSKKNVNRCSKLEVSLLSVSVRSLTLFQMSVGSASFTNLHLFPYPTANISDSYLAFFMRTHRFVHVRSKSGLLDYSVKPQSNFRPLENLPNVWRCLSGNRIALAC